MHTKYYVHGKNKTNISIINTFSLNVFTVHLCDKIAS